MIVQVLGSGVHFLTHLHLTSECKFFWLDCDYKLYIWHLIFVNNYPFQILFGQMFAFSDLKNIIFTHTHTHTKDFLGEKKIGPDLSSFLNFFIFQYPLNSG